MINKKICLLAAAVAVIVCSNNNVYAFSSEDVNTSPAEFAVNETDIKANKEALEKAKLAMELKDYPTAITYLNAYIEGKSKRYEPYKLRGECYYAMRQYELAEKDFQTAVDIKSADDKFITGTKIVSAVILGADKEEQKQNAELGNLYGELMYAQKALNNPAYEVSYQKAFQYNSHIYLPKPNKNDISKMNCPQKYGKVLNPQGDEVYLQEVINNIEKEDFHEAAYKLSNLQNAYPEYYLTYYLTGVVMNGLDHENDAISSFEKAYKLNPYDFESLASLGLIYYNRAENTLSKDDANKSIEYFDKAIKLNPNYNTYYYFKGLNNLLSENYDSAISDFNSAIKLKTNDYNSMYYKAIALYLKGDYEGVVDLTTKLLLRHVSNYNSVLYLRALAHHQSGKNEAAISDVENVFNNINDIYNADIKVLSPKEKTLSNYLYLLKSQILAQGGQGTKADLQTAYENPVIKLLDKGAGQSDISAYDFQNQYDYMRTAFAQKKYKISYKNPDYVIVAETGTKNVVVEKPQLRDITESSVSEHFAAQALSDTDSKPEPAVAQTTAPEETLAQDENSLAQELAEKSLLPNLHAEEQAEQKIEKAKKNVSEVVEQAAEKAEETVSEVVEQTTEKAVETVSEVVEQTAEKVEEQIVEVEKPVIDEKVAENTLQTAELRPKQEISQAVVQNENKEQIADNIMAAEKPAPQEEIAENTTIAAEETPAVSSERKPLAIHENHTDISVKTVEKVQKPALVIKDDDEVVLLDTTIKTPSLEEKISKISPSELQTHIENAANTVEEKVQEIVAVQPEEKSEEISSETVTSAPDKEAETEIKVPEINISPDDVKKEVQEAVAEDVAKADTLQPAQETDIADGAEKADIAAETSEVKNTKKRFWFKKKEKEEETLAEFLNDDEKLTWRQRRALEKSAKEIEKARKQLEESEIKVQDLGLRPAEEITEPDKKPEKKHFWRNLFKRKAKTAVPEIIETKPEQEVAE